MQCVYDRTCAMYIVHMQCVVAAAAAADVALPKCNKLISFKRDFKWLYWSNDSLKTASTRTIRGSLVQMTRSSPRHLANSFATIINVYEELAVAAPFFWYEPRQVILSEGQVVGVFFIDLMYSRDVVASASFVLWVLISHCVLKTVLFFHKTPLFFFMRALSLSAQIENIHSTPTIHSVYRSGLWMCCQSFRSLSRIVGAHCETFFLFYQIRFTNSFAIVHTLFLLLSFRMLWFVKKNWAPIALKTHTHVHLYYFIV